MFCETSREDKYLHFDINKTELYRRHNLPFLATKHVQQSPCSTYIWLCLQALETKSVDWLPFEFCWYFYKVIQRLFISTSPHLGRSFWCPLNIDWWMTGKLAQMFFRSAMQGQLCLTVLPQLFIFFLFCHYIQLAITCTNTSKWLGWKLKKKQIFFPIYDIIPGTLQ